MFLLCLYDSIAYKSSVNLGELATIAKTKKTDRLDPILEMLSGYRLLKLSKQTKITWSNEFIEYVSMCKFLVNHHRFSVQSLQK